MNRSDILLQVKDAESRAQQIVKEAEERQRAIIASARKEAASFARDAEERLKAESEARFAKEREGITAEKQASLIKGKQEAAQIRAKAESKIPNVIVHLMQGFERTLDASAGKND